jgi:hypothetical protein
VLSQTTTNSVFGYFNQVAFSAVCGRPVEKPEGSTVSCTGCKVFMRCNFDELPSPTRGALRVNQNTYVKYVFGICIALFQDTLIKTREVYR